MSFSVWIWLFLGKNDVDVSMYQDCTLVEPKWCLNVSVRVWVLQGIIRGRPWLWVVVLE
ncbi:unnamed protein product [Brassica oleracea]|uniref:(rape) hypothetical protein n=1 Tax=Brassica napus TaxID=3708 RepID=A0A816S292_BRANA|nr:unnamed protein product [Brassica napus]